jgi:hypothetical protein
LKARLLVEFTADSKKLLFQEEIFLTLALHVGSDLRSNK